MEIKLPYSKSLLLREIALGYSAEPEPARGCRDVEELRAALEALRKGVEELHIEEGGAPLRFLLAIAAWTPGYCGRISVGPRLAERPVDELLKTLRQTGARLSFDVSAREFSVQGVERKAEDIIIDASVSSQFVSAMMLAASLSPRLLRIRSLSGLWEVSRPYIDMTAEVMRRHGWKITVEEGNVFVEPRKQSWKEKIVVPEADWSAAAFIIGMLEVSRARGCNPGAPDMPGLLTEGSLQGDSIFPQLLSKKESDYDLRSTPDLAMPLCATLLMLGRPFRMTGLETLPAKESDRLEAMCREFDRFGYTLEVVANHGLIWNGEKRHIPLCRIPVRTDGDHRIALAMKMMELDGWQVDLDNPGCVDKSWPGGDLEVSRVAAELRGFQDSGRLGS